jgi:hypothetical protein
MDKIGEGANGIGGEKLLWAYRGGRGGRGAGRRPNLERRSRTLLPQELQAAAALQRAWLLLPI